MNTLEASLLQPDISVIVPAYMEGRREPYFRQMLESTHEQFSNTYGSSKYEIIVVNDGSTDNTAAIALDYEVVLIDRQHNRGKGAVVKEGMLYADGDIRTFTDADGSYSPATLVDLIGAVRKGADIAVARREGHASFIRKLGHDALAGICEHLASTNVSDVQAGAKAFSRDATEAIWPNVNINGYAADRQALYIARRLGMEVAEINAPVTVVEDSHVRAFRDGARMVGDAWRIPRHTSIPATSDDEWLPKDVGAFISAVPLRKA